MKTTKDLLAFHMLNGCDDETLEKINKLLKLSGKDADNSNAKSIVENSHEKEEVTKKKIITKDIQSIQSTSQETQESIEIPMGSIRPRNRGQNESLFIENDGLKKEKEMYKAKLKSIENELKTLKSENSKLKDENTSELQEKIKEKDAQIEKLKIMDKDRIAVLAELEQKNKLNMDLNNQIQLLENENLEKDKTIESSQSTLKDLNKQIEYKDFTVDGLIKKNNALEQEKENLFIDYQKKIEELQLQVLDSASSAMDSTSGLCKVIDILNSNVDEFKNIFKKKIDNFEDIFDKFKSEYIKRDESFTFMLNDKTKEFHEFINKFVGGAQGDVQNVFNNVNTPTSDIKDRKIDWLNKQVNSLTEYKNKLIEYENKYKDLNSKKEVEDKKFNEIKDCLAQLNKKMAEKNETYEKLKNKHDENEKKFKGMEDFMKKYFKKELIEQFKQQCGN
jgi:DNA repair exonuclease SbcCD ATPase subunit